MWFDHWAVVWLAPVAVWILLSGLDDLFIDIVFFLKREAFTWPREAELAQASQRHIAILVPLWHEHQVIGQMLRHNHGREPTFFSFCQLEVSQIAKTCGLRSRRTCVHGDPPEEEF